MMPTMCGGKGVAAEWEKDGEGEGNGKSSNQMKHFKVSDKSGV